MQIIFKMYTHELYLNSRRVDECIYYHYRKLHVEMVNRKKIYN